MPRVDLKEEMVKKHDELPCLFCGQMLKASTNFFTSASRNSILRADNKGETKSIICKDCAQNLYNYLFNIFRDAKKAMYNFCSAIDVYYEEELFQNLIERKVDSEKMVAEYFKLLNSDIKYSGKTFADSKTIIVEEKTEAVDESQILTDEDRRNRQEILSVFHYDPFDKSPIMTRKKLYRDLVTMADPAMTDDLVRQRAAIEIVRSFDRIDTWTETINEISADPQRMQRSSKELKALIEAKNKETDMVTKFSKDHGFAERYATAKSRGAGTLTATIRDMEDYDYDDGKVNMYDIKTSKSMTQAAEISEAAIMKQLSLSEADYVDMLKQQRQRLVDLQKDLDRTKETNRLIYKQIVKQELLKELATDLVKKGLDKNEIFNMVMAEIHFDDKLLNKQNKKLTEKKEGKS